MTQLCNIFCGASGKILSSGTRVAFIQISRRLRGGELVGTASLDAVGITTRLCMIDYEPSALYCYGTYDGLTTIILDDKTSIDITKTLGCVVDENIFSAIILESSHFMNGLKQRVWNHIDIELAKKAKDPLYSFKNSTFMGCPETVTGLGLSNGFFLQYEEDIMNDSAIYASCVISKLEFMIVFIYGLFYLGRQLQPNMYAGSIDNRNNLKVVFELLKGGS